MSTAVDQKAASQTVVRYASPGAVRGEAAPNELNALILKVRGLFDQSRVVFRIALVYADLLERTRDVNCTYKGWSLLHYCSFTCSFSGSYSAFKPLLKVVKGLIQLRADVNLRDPEGRTPIYFLSDGGAEDKGRMLRCLLDAGAQVNPENPIVQPLHVTATFLWLQTKFLVRKGANPYALDKFGRMPLHCLVIARAFMIENAKNLLKHAPLSVEHADNFENYPLYYALVYGKIEAEVYGEIESRVAKEFVQLLLRATSGIVIQRVLRKITEEQAAPEFPPNLGFNDPIYQHDDEFSPRIAGGGRARAAKPKDGILRELQSTAAVAVRNQTYSKGGITYYLHADAHGGKHLPGTVVSKLPKRDFIERTKRTSATFYPELTPNYPAMVAHAIRMWADAGANEDQMWIEFSGPIGADEGSETSWVELYYRGELGSHIRPKSIPLGKSSESKKVKALNEAKEGALAPKPVVNAIATETLARKENRSFLETLLRNQTDSIEPVYKYLLADEAHDLFA